MAQKKIYLIRHGKASMEGSDRERNLDEDGKVQAISLCKKIKKEFQDKKIKIFSSPFARAVQTVENLSQDMNVQIEQIASLEEIKMGKDSQFNKHQIIEKMWEDKDFKTEDGVSQSEHVNNIKVELDKIFNDFYDNEYDLILVSHGNSIGIILKYFFKIQFAFEDWKKISMPDMYFLEFDKENNVTKYKRDIEGIEKIFTI
jgi:2,3-bisphosphoglycerate-dependent phosphoglycerate mutase|tara:strand:+ start:223 stop:825 length:603 start_codon:yes stop_codon:yes gene_type:complete